MSAPAHSARRLLASALLTAAVAPLNSTMIAVALPAIGNDFGTAPEVLTQVLVTSFLVASLVLQSPAGKLVDLWGIDRVMRLGRGLFLAGALIGALSPHLAGVFVARMAMAAAGAGLIPAAMAAVRHLVPPHRLAHTLGLVGALFALAAAVGPALGGYLSTALGWPALFWVNLPMLGIGIWLAGGARFPAPVHPGGVRPRFDTAGALLLGVTLAGIVAALHLGGPLRAVALAATALGAAAFVALELRVAEPVIELRLLRIRAIRAGSATLFLQNFALFPIIFLVPYLLTRAHGLDTAQAGITVMAMTLGMLASSLAGARVAQWVGVRATAVLGTLASLAGLGLLAQQTDVALVWRLTPAMALMGCGIGLSSAPIQGAILHAVPPAQAGMASGAVTMVRYLANALGVATLGLLLARGDAADPALYRSALAGYLWPLTVALLVALRLPGRVAAPPAPVPDEHLID